jgi:hypothetical protein
VKKLEKMFDYKDDISQRKATNKFKCSQPFIYQKLRNKTNIKVRAKQKSPQYSEEQIKVVRTQCRRLLRKSADKVFVLDDESYFTLTKYQMPGNNILHFWSK